MTGTKVKLSTLGKVPSATRATTADNAASADNATKLGDSPAASYVKGPAEAWNEVTAFGTCSTMGSLWDNYNATTNSTAAYYRDPLGVVHLKGTIACGGDPAALGGSHGIFELPPGYLPAKDENFITPSAGGASVVLVAGASGADVRWVGGADPGSNGFLDLDGISFRCEPSGANGCP